MENWLDYLRQLNIVSMMLRIILALLMGGLIGMERERKRRPAGFRTYMLGALGAAVCELAVRKAQHAQLRQNQLVLAEQHSAGQRQHKQLKHSVRLAVVSGVGFLGAGTIIVTGRQEVKGLTTAAGLWASACMGLAIGAGFYECMIIGFILIFLCMRILPLIENAVMAKARNMNIYVEMDSVENVGAIVSLIKSENITLYDLEIDKEQHEHLTQINAVFSLHLPHKEDHTEVLARLSTLDGIITIEEV